ncbi:MAG: hypothetical protein KDI06_14305 [Calditrichaeota bacterium]|nr:hypothetical protein [Calditrichota bacterium]HQU73915.1 hypothetical protein [Calditrichia bacterium]
MKIFPIIFIFMVLTFTEDCPAQVFSSDDLKIHGFLTQAYAISDNHQIFGIPTSGTTDYRSLALQFHYPGPGNLSATLQLAHFRMGQHPSNDFLAPVELDWAFLQYRINEKMYVRFGKVLMPLGIYNEVRDVGLVLPFYRAPYTPYSEGQYVSETFNGGLIYVEQQLGEAWSASLDLYAGGWEWLDWWVIQNPLSGQTDILTGRPKIDNGIGLQGWLYSPIEGLRLGISLQQADIHGGITFQEDNGIAGIGSQVMRFANLSFDGDFEAWLLRSEMVFLKYNNFPLKGFGYYLQPGLRILSNTWAYFQYQVMQYWDLPNIATGEKTSTKFLKDLGVSLKWQLSLNIALKFESHWTYSKQIEDAYANPYSQDLPFTRYAVFSISNSF